MTDRLSLLLVAIFAVLANLAATKDVPCASMTGAGGYVCVCNGTYCDTVEVPKKLKRGSYYFYSTAELTPGFTKTTGKFLNTTASLEVQQTATTSNISADVYVWLEPTVEFQTYKGIGAAITDNAGIVIKTLSSAAQKKLVDSYYGVTGIEYTFARLPIGCSDFSPSVYTYDEVAGDVSLEYFNLTDNDYDYKIPFLKKAAKASKRGLKIVGNSWTAPGWLKTNNESSAPGYIREEYYSVWANYHLKFLEAYKKAGVDIYALSMGNEVTLGLLFGGFFKFPNTIMLPAEARNFTKYYMGPTINASAFKDVKLLFLEDMRPFMTWWSDRMYVDEDVYDYVAGIALHWYFDASDNVDLLENYNTNYPDKFILYTESSLNSFQSGGTAVDLGDWTRAVRYINNIFQNYQHWVVGYMDWNLALNTAGGPAGPSGMELDASIIVNATADEFYKQPIYYVLGHFSKFIHPGSKRINTTISQQDNSTDSYFVESGIEDMSDLVGRPTGTPPTGGTGGMPTGGSRPTGGMPTGGSSGTTESPFPTRTPDASSNTVVVVATNNPDGSRSVIAYNPRSETANLIITDPDVGTFNQTVQANSLNSFVFWPDATAI